MCLTRAFLGARYTRQYEMEYIDLVKAAIGNHTQIEGGSTVHIYN